MSYLSRSSAANAAIRKGWKSYTTYFDKKMQVWYNREVNLNNPAIEWEKHDFVHHVEFSLVEGGKLKPTLVVNCRREEITEEIPVEFGIEPLTRDLWNDIADSEISKGLGIRAKSEIESPVKVVWRIADEMKGQDRKAVIAACIEAGVNKATASTQFYKWQKAQS